MTGSLLGGTAEQQMREIARRVLSESQYTQRRSISRAEANLGCLVAKSSSELSGISGDTPGSVSALLYYVSTGGTLTQVSSDTQTVYNAGPNAIKSGKYFVTKQTNFGRFFAGEYHQRPRVGKLGTATTHTDTGVVTLWDQSGTSMPAATTATETGLNITGATLAASVFVRLVDTDNFALPTIEPLELGDCA